MNRKEVRALLGDKFSEGEYGRCYYTTAKARVDLDFSHYTSEGDGDEAYRLHGIYVRQGAETESPKRFPSFIPGPGSSRLGGGDQFGGIGVMLLKNPDTEELEIRGVVPASPAAKAGLQPGLVVLSIDDVPMEGKRLSEAVELARGAVGTMMKLEVFDPKKNESRVVELTRAEIAFAGTESWGRQTNITLSADEVLRLEATNGARAVIQLLGLTSGGGRSGDHEDSASYRWRFRASMSAPIQSGTNTAVDKYTLKLIGPNRFDRTSRNSGEEGRIKAGEMALDWSYGYTNKGYIRLDSSRFTPSVHGREEFETGP